RPGIARQRMVVLHEIDVDAMFGETLPVPGLAKPAARVAETLQCDDQDPVERRPFDHAATLRLSPRAVATASSEKIVIVIMPPSITSDRKCPPKARRSRAAAAAIVNRAMKATSRSSFGTRGTRQTSQKAPAASPETKEQL